jgi:hypothetical protein
MSGKGIGIVVHIIGLLICGILALFYWQVAVPLAIIFEIGYWYLFYVLLKEVKEIQEE